MCERGLIRDRVFADKQETVRSLAWASLDTDTQGGGRLTYMPRKAQDCQPPPK